MEGQCSSSTQNVNGPIFGSARPKSIAMANRGEILWLPPGGEDGAASQWDEEGRKRGKMVRGQERRPMRGSRSLR